MHDSQIHAQYATGKDEVLSVLTTKGADALVYKYTGGSQTDYDRVLEMPSRTRSLFTSSIIENVPPKYQWSTTSSRNIRLHHMNGATTRGDKLVKVTIHNSDKIRTAAQSAMNEVLTHIAMVEYESKYVPVLYDVACFKIEDKWVNVMIMAFLTGAGLAKLYELRKEKYGFKFVTIAERNQLQEALRDLWAVGGAHMDLHRNNIIVSEQGRLYIIDFSRSAKLDKRFYTQQLTLSNQRKRVAAILGKDAPTMQSREEILSAASHYLYAYPELFAFENMKSQKVKGRSSRQALELLQGIRQVRTKVIPTWNKPRKSTWALLARKRVLETKLNKALGVRNNFQQNKT